MPPLEPVSSGDVLEFRPEKIGKVVTKSCRGMNPAKYAFSSMSMINVGRDDGGLDQSSLGVSRESRHRRVQI